MDKDTYLILGYGRCGLESQRYLDSKGNAVIVYDDSIIQKPTIIWNKIKAVIQSPGIAPSHPIALAAREANVAIYTDIDLLQKRSPAANYIGITGTNGKSTNTALIGHILKECGIKVAIGGNIGTPALALEELGDNDWYVLELSSYQLELSNCINLDIAVFLNVTPDHLERHLSMEAYVKAKTRIFDQAKYAFIALDDEYCKTIAGELSIPHKTIASKLKTADLWIDASSMLHVQDQLFDLNELTNLKGLHNWQNVALAFAATSRIVNSSSKIWEAIKSFPGLAHRQQLVAKINTVEFINDSKATNADATEKALKTFIGKKIFWIVGGKAKTEGIDTLVYYFPFIHKAYLIGEAKNRFAKNLCGKLVFEESVTLDKAIKSAYIDAKNETNAVVLLSPACASFDQFLDFEHRGDEFIRIVNELINDSNNIL